LIEILLAFLTVLTSTSFGVSCCFTIMQRYLPWFWLHSATQQSCLLLRAHSYHNSCIQAKWALLLVLLLAAAVAAA
jgi:hypothetical protein